LKITPISAHAWQLTRFGLVNAYLVRESDGFTVIDTMLPGSGKDIIDAARQCEATGIAEIKRILLTHAHADHIGGLDGLAGLLGKADIIISQRDALLLPPKPEQNRTLLPGEPQCPVKGSFSGAKSKPTHFVSDGELFGSLRCFATPGHTPGHFSFLDERDGTLYAGDALSTVGGDPHISGWCPWYFPLPNFATWHRPTARQSVERMDETIAGTVPLRAIAPGHGPVLKGGRELLDRALAEAR
jgi:glyoxylase-like metal-dependent hydrolase (beta-lactamase superfamily II)